MAQLVSQAAPSSSSTTAEFTPDGKLKRPVGLHRWVFLVRLWHQTLETAERRTSQISTRVCGAEESRRIFEGGFLSGRSDHYHGVDPGSSANVSGWFTHRALGRGYSTGNLTGLTASVRDSKRSSKNQWVGILHLGHHPMPYAETAAESSVSECAGWHLGNVADIDMTWVHF
jgi:hypothetical protein